MPPVAAAGQKSYKPAAGGTTSTRMCAWEPFCKHTVDVCGGYRRSGCKYNANFRGVSEEEFEKKKSESRREKNGARMAQKRAQKKKEAPNA